MPPRIYTVSQIQSHVRRLLEEQGSVWVEGEISGHRCYPSGHHYFTLKDEGAQLSAVLWRSTAQRLRFELEDGMLVRARGTLTVYEVRGNYQMVVDGVEPVGQGPLQVRFEQMRKRLEAEGLFDAAHKVPLPQYPLRIALITSLAGAAVRDLITVARRRWPAVELVVVPVKVQGDGAAEEIAEAIALADTLDFDVLIVGRGGGSLEDLWAFNEEVVARAIFAAETPVVSAVGHEVDFTISDFVADLRAPTPSAAAESVVPDRVALEGWLDERRARLARALLARVNDLAARLREIEASRVFRQPLAPLREREQGLDLLALRLTRAFGDRLERRRADLDRHAGRLDALSPLRVLARGYSVTQLRGRPLRRASDARPGDRLRTVLADGELCSEVTMSQDGEEEGRGLRSPS